jgi:hypothetical protein
MDESTRTFVGPFAFVRMGEMDISDQGRRTLQNIFALAILAIILLGGAWVFSDLKPSAFLLNCLSSGRRDGRHLLTETAGQFL